MSKVLPFKSRGLRNELREAMQQRTPVRLEREPIQHGVLHGYVIGLSSDFCLIAEIGDAMRLDGYLVVAVGDITHLEVDPAREFVDKALALRGETLRIPDEFRLDDWAAIAHSASACAPLLSINMIEDDEGEISYVGQYAGLEETSSSCAKWIPTPIGTPMPVVTNSRRLVRSDSATAISMRCGRWPARRATSMRRRVRLATRSIE